MTDLGDALFGSEPHVIEVRHGIPRSAKLVVAPIQGDCPIIYAIEFAQITPLPRYYQPSRPLPFRRLPCVSGYTACLLRRFLVGARSVPPVGWHNPLVMPAFAGRTHFSTNLFIDEPYKRGCQEKDFRGALVFAGNEERRSGKRFRHSLRPISRISDNVRRLPSTLSCLCSTSLRRRRAAGLDRRHWALMRERVLAICSLSGAGAPHAHKLERRIRRLRIRPRSMRRLRSSAICASSLSSASSDLTCGQSSICRITTEILDMPRGHVCEDLFNHCSGLPSSA